MSSSIFKDLAKQRKEKFEKTRQHEREARDWARSQEIPYSPPQEAQEIPIPYCAVLLDDQEELTHEEELEQTVDNSPEIIYESEWHQAFGSECKEYLGKYPDGRFCYGLEIGDQDLSWHGSYETRGEAEEHLQAAYERWDKRAGELEQAWEERQIERLEKQTSLNVEDVKEQIEALDVALEFNATKRAAELRGYISVDQSKVGDLVRLEAMELRAQRERLYNQLQGLNTELGLQQEIGLER